MLAVVVGVVVTHPVAVGVGFAVLAIGISFVWVAANGGWNESDFAIVANCPVL
jgi:hypothetical protein